MTDKQFESIRYHLINITFFVFFIAIFCLIICIKVLEK
jgi:hypothetical protein